VAAKRRFQLVLIKPSHYDDDGYVIRWLRAMIPSNSLAAIYGIAADCAERQVLGPDIDIDIALIDETNTYIDIPSLLVHFQRHAGFGLVALIGVQSNQYPRALDIARPFREARIQIKLLVNFATTVRLEKVHPLQGGILRLKHPSERRPGLSRESAWTFWPRFVWETISKHTVIIAMISRLLLLKLAISRDPAAKSYRDRALTPVGDDNDETLDLMTKTTGGRAALAHVKKIAELTGGG
jgi:hypothetical protein